MVRANLGANPGFLKLLTAEAHRQELRRSKEHLIRSR